jgi:hypothetical protein
LAIDRSWFFELGAYDPGIRVWGAEQSVELFDEISILINELLSDTNSRSKFGNAEV